MTREELREALSAAGSKFDGRVTHGSARSESEVAILHVKTRTREKIKITRMIIVKMGDDHVQDQSWIDADKAQ